MTWEQIYEGRFFEGKIPKQYGIQAIPATYLVDGDRGEILAMGDDLRGERLAKTVESRWRRKGSSCLPPLL